MLQMQKSDLSYGNGTKTGLPKPLVGGMKLDSVEMPVCAARRSQRPPADIQLSYSLARGCVKLLNGETAGVELVGRSSDKAPTAVHFVLSNGTSHAWVYLDHCRPDSGPALKLCGMPFSSQLVNYNAGIAVGLFLLLHRDKYPDFASAVGKAVDAWQDKNEMVRAQALALMADEMAVCVEDMLEGQDAQGIQPVIMDRHKPEDIDKVFDGGDTLGAAFISPDGFKQLAVMSANAPIEADNTQPPSDMTFLGDLPVKLTDCILRGKHVLLTGPTATGKTLAVEEVCMALGAPLTTIRGSEGIEDRDLVGATTITTKATQEGGIASETVFTYGPIPEAMILGRRQYELHLHELENAARENREPVRIPPSVLLIDEINRLQLRFQNFLVSAMNVRKATADYYLRIPDNNEEIMCPDGFLVIVVARNVGTVFAGTGSMDLALERRFYKKIDVEYLTAESESTLVQSRTGLDSKLTQVLVKVASDTRYQLSQLKAPMDTDTLLKWAEELAHINSSGESMTQSLVLETARDVVFDIVLERSERGNFDPAGEAVLTDNVLENWRDAFAT